jgi:hypothetical protein
VDYNQDGTQHVQVSIDATALSSSSTIQISSETVTVSARTNSLLICLTFVVLLFPALQLPVEDQHGTSPHQELAETLALVQIIVDCFAFAAKIFHPTYQIRTVRFQAHGMS